LNWGSSRCERDVIATRPRARVTIVVMEEFKRFTFCGKHMSMRTVVVKNLALMNARGRGSMKRFLTKESMAGNAGKTVINGKEYNCQAANFYYDKETGEIVKFSNMDGELQETHAKGIFRFAVDMTNEHFNSYFKIVETRYGAASPEANATIQGTASAYNMGAAERRPAA